MPAPKMIERSPGYYTVTYDREGVGEVKPHGLKYILTTIEKGHPTYVCNGMDEVVRHLHSVDWRSMVGKNPLYPNR